MGFYHSGHKRSSHVRLEDIQKDAWLRVVIPVADAFNGFAADVRDRLFDAGLRAEVDASDETMKYKIRAAQTQQTPYMLIVGEREQTSDTVSVRHRRRGDLGGMGVDAFATRIHHEITTKALEA